MFLVESKTGHLVEVLEMKKVFDPFEEEFEGRLNYGEDLPPAQSFKKSEVGFQSGEALPRCWVDPHYRDDELRRHA